MKLAKVVHVRCHRRSFDEAETYVWVDDAMSSEEFADLVKCARTAYDQAGKDFEQAEQPPVVPWGPDFSKFPNKTVAEVTAEHEVAKGKLDAWKKRKEEAQANFAHHLKAVGEGRIVYFWENKLGLDVELDWGHRHGQDIAYGETEIKDLPGTIEREDRYF
jgi:hypothetical protein